jgi:hypothetical protein
VALEIRQALRHLKAATGEHHQQMALQTTVVAVAVVLLLLVELEPEPPEEMAVTEQRHLFLDRQ